MKERSIPPAPSIILVSIVGLLNLIIGIMVSALLTDFREFKIEVRGAIAVIEARNIAQDDLSSEIRRVGFERIGKIEVLLDAYEKRISRLENLTKGGN
jgi:hypothetical protein